MNGGCVQVTNVTGVTKVTGSYGGCGDHEQKDVAIFFRSGESQRECPPSKLYPLPGILLDITKHLLRLDRTTNARHGSKTR